MTDWVHASDLVFKNYSYIVVESIGEGPSELEDVQGKPDTRLRIDLAISNSKFCPSLNYDQKNKTLYGLLCLDFKVLERVGENNFQL